MPQCLTLQSTGLREEPRRYFRLEDAVAKDQLYPDPDIKRHLGAPTKLEDDIADFERQGYGLVVIVEVSTDHILGYAKLQCPDWKEDLGLELIVAVAPKARRRGFALEAAQMLIGSCKIRFFFQVSV